MGDEYKSYESFYNGGISAFKDSYGQFIGGKHNYASNLGFPGSTQTGNQLGEAVKAIKQGVKAFEVTMGIAGQGQAGQAEQIPTQNFEEMRALMKLSGVSPSVHGPFDIDASGFNQQTYSEEARVDAERRLFNVLEKAKMLSNDKNVNVVFHSSGGIPGITYKAGNESKGEDRFHPTKIVLVDKESGKLAAELKEERIYFPGREKDFESGGTLQKPFDRIDTVNRTQWDEKLSSIAQLKKITNEVIGNSTILLAPYKDIPLTNENLGEVLQSMNPSEQQAFNKLQDANIFLDNARLSFSSAFNLAYKYGNSEQKEELKELSEEYSKEIKKSQGSIASVAIQNNALDHAVKKLHQITQEDTPKMLVEVEEFARGKAAQTFGNLAWKGYEKLGGELAPVVAIENMMPGEWAHSTPEGMKSLIEASRKKFIENAMDGGLSESDAKSAAKKLIGATWDVGHLNIMKKHGFEDKDIIEATKKIAPYVKEVHLTDNFGFSDSHLAPGMGNVPIRQILEQLEKKGDIAGMQKIVEGVGFVQHFQRSPHGWTMAALGSPIYGAMMGPYWNQGMNMAAGGGGYFGAPMAYMPEKHFSLYGSGFSTLPTELGGQMPGTGSRVTGTPNA
jgi:sugar phosphate isomerase/epimerase